MLEEFTEILGTQCSIDLVHIFRAQHFPSGVFDDGRHPLIVDHGRPSDLVAELIAAAERFGHLEHTLHFLMDLLMDRFIGEAQGTHHIQALGDHVLGEPAVDRANADDGRLERVDAAGNDGIQAKDDVSQQVERINRLVGMSTVAALAGDRRIPCVHTA